ncbi:putative ABC-type ferric hydroxamate transporter [Helianthus annuus]|nr:putative ABC-type ferric hydroxamate transporter [Helianthus annuus]KAJ0890824.1 putative ABC-type ferric hydroxamate transporter [Helianthus annuus]
MQDNSGLNIIRSISRGVEDVLSIGSGGSPYQRSSPGALADEEALRWAALEKLPTYNRVRTTIFKNFNISADLKDRTPSERMLLDVRELDAKAHQEFIDKIFKDAEEDNGKFLTKFRERVDRVGITLPTVEVRFQNLTIEADCYVGDRALPSLPNAARNMVESLLGSIGISLSKKTKITILKNISGIIKPSRMALLLGPPSSGKTTLLLALAGKLDSSLKVEGDITYNGHKLNEFVPQRTSAYISQYDVHAGEMTVKETLDFSARCQGVGSRMELLAELARREKQVGIYPEADIDLFMKGTALEGDASSLITYYTLRILGLDICRDTLIGDVMRQGISGGQKKRVTTGEMLVGPAKTLFMDEISTGLDSSTTFQIVKCLQQVVHLTDSTIFMSLLQPAPETFDLFDDIILLSEGQIVYQGPREYALEFFEDCGFRCPERKGIPDFLQEVTSRKDQEQYWADRSKPYTYIPVSKFVERFKQFHVGEKLKDELSIPYDRNQSHKAALVFKKYTVPKRELLKASWNKEWLLMKRNSFIYIFKTIQYIILSCTAMTVYFRSRMHTRNEEDGSIYIGTLLFSLLLNMFNGLAEISFIIIRLPVIFKQRDLLFHPPWAYTLPTFLLRLPSCLLESILWMAIVYYGVGLAPEASRFFKHFLLVFMIQNVGGAYFRFISGICRTMNIANTGGTLALLLIFLLGGFIIPRSQLLDCWEWGYWVSPLSYGFKSLAINEFFSHRWMNKMSTDNTTRLGIAILENMDIPTQESWFWIGFASLVGFAVLFNILFTFALMYLDPLGKQQAIISKEASMGMQAKKDGSTEKELVRSQSGSYDSKAPKKGMILPFTPLSMSFDNMNYFVDMPREMREQGVTENRLQLLCEVSGAFRPGVLTSLMGVSGAGKTTLLDVLAGRKTSGYIEGDIRISGYPKKQETFARISGYCEQNDIHSPNITVYESLIYSAFLRLPKEVSDEEKMIFVREVMELVELDNLKDTVVGLPGISGLSTEQRKRLTIAVELVANPSIIFMDEPTSGLDARAAAIVMRTVRNTVDTGRTVVCTIHQPSIDIFESFDELLLLKRGGQMIYAGPLGRNSRNIIDYFEEIPGVSKMPDKYNPSTWMLEVTSTVVESRLGIDFAEHFKSSDLYQKNAELVMRLSTPPPGATDLHFSTQYSQSSWGQFKSCIWKMWWSYWRNPDYNLVRNIFTFVAALLVGITFWKIGEKRESSNNVTTIVGALYAGVFFVGMNNCQTVQPVVASERTVFYRERAAGMYSTLPYALAQVLVEIPYVFVATTYYTLIVYAMVSFEWSATKFLWFFFINFFSFLYFTYYGLMTVALTPNDQIAAVVAVLFYGLFNFFSGFFIPRPRIPKWWIWYYWICPIAWTVYGFIISQYHDVENTITVPGMSYDPPMNWYIKDHFGFRLDFMGPVAAVLVGFCLLFAFIYAFCLRTLNFQVR